MDNDLTTEKFWVADKGNNLVKLFMVAKDDPLPVWSSMTNRINAGDIMGAVSKFAGVSAEKYQQAFFSIGASDLNSAIGQIGAVIMDYIGDDEAEGYFTKTIGGQVITFPVHFVKENGVWKILEF
jgi:hypothetical protein